jgi:hypothetical protein
MQRERERLQARDELRTGYVGDKETSVRTRKLRDRGIEGSSLAGQDWSRIFISLLFLSVLSTSGLWQLRHVSVRMTKRSRMDSINQSINQYRSPVACLANWRAPPVHPRDTFALLKHTPGALTGNLVKGPPGTVPHTKWASTTDIYPAIYISISSTSSPYLSSICICHPAAFAERAPAHPPATPKTLLCR